MVQESPTDGAEVVHVPFVSVAVPTYNRADKLATCVASLLAQDYPKDRYEVIVVDDGSTDETASTMETLQARNAGRPMLRYFQLPHAGVNVARNAAFSHATGDPICLVDDDEDVPPSWLAALVAGAQRNPGSGCLGGPVRLRPEGRLPRMCGKEPLGESELDLGDEEREVEVVWSGNMALRRFALEQVGGFNEELRRLGGTEVEWERRLRDLGGHVVYVPDAWLWHRRTQRDLRLYRLVYRRFSRGRGQALNAALSGTGYRSRSSLRDMRIGLVHTARRRCSVGLLRFALSAGRLLGTGEAKLRRLGSNASPCRKPKAVATFKHHVVRFGWWVGSSLFVRETTSRWRTAAANQVLRAKYECPCCGWKGRRLASYIQPSRDASIANEECPRCHSHSRDRAFALWLRSDFDLASRRGVALVLAPEACLRPLWEAVEGAVAGAVDGLTVHGIDLMPKPDVEVIADLRNLPVRGRIADVVWCHHVLEHIEDDHAAMAELMRVLKPDAGELVVSVPMVPGPTVEFSFADGHRDGHWRMYGDDFVERLTAAGLVVEPVQLALDPAQARRYRIRPLSFSRCRVMQSQSGDGNRP